jgi:hypothetical protein
MTGAERQAPYRATRAAGTPIIRMPTGAASVQRWSDSIAPVTGLQAEYAAWLAALRDNQQDGATAEGLRATVELDFSELQAIEPPRGFGRD